MIVQLVIHRAFHLFLSDPLLFITSARADIGSPLEQGLTGRSEYPGSPSDDSDTDVDTTLKLSGFSCGGAS